MTILNGKLILAAAVSLVLAGCGGGTSEPEATEADVSATVQDSATDATAVVEETAADAGNTLEQTAESTTDAASTAADSVMEAADGAGWNDLQNNWQDSIGSIKDRWAELTEEDLMSVNGDRDALVTLVQDKYGLDRETAESQVNDWASTL